MIRLRPVDVPPVPLRLGPVFRQTAEVISANLGAFVVAGVTFATTVHALLVLLASTGQAGGLVALAVSVILYPLVTAAMTYVAVQSLRGRHTGLGQALSTGLAHLVPLLAVSVVTGLAIGIGTLLFIVPGLILRAVFAVVIPAALIERLGVRGAIVRSVRLTEGARLPVFGVVLAVGLASYLLSELLFSGTAGAPAVLAGVVIGSLEFAVTAAYPAVIYVQLRQAKESVGVEEIAPDWD